MHLCVCMFTDVLMHLCVCLDLKSINWCLSPLFSILFTKVRISPWMQSLPTPESLARQLDLRTPVSASPVKGLQEAAMLALLLRGLWGI